jgi:hypothetical protein
MTLYSFFDPSGRHLFAVGLPFCRCEIMSFVVMCCGGAHNIRRIFNFPDRKKIRIRPRIKGKCYIQQLLSFVTKGMAILADTIFPRNTLPDAFP